MTTLNLIVNYLVDKFNRLVVKNEGSERKFVLGVRWDGFAKESDTDEPLESIYMDVPRMVRDVGPISRD